MNMLDQSTAIILSGMAVNSIFMLFSDQYLDPNTAAGLSSDNELFFVCSGDQFRSIFFTLGVGYLTF